MEQEVFLEIVDFCAAKGSLKTHCVKSKIIELISNRLKAAVPNLATLHSNLELQRLIGCCVENCVKPKHNLDKNEVILGIFKECFPLLSEKDMEIVMSNIKMMTDCGLIKKVPYSKRVWRYICGMSKKKDT